MHLSLVIESLGTIDTSCELREDHSSFCTRSIRALLAW